VRGLRFTLQAESKDSCIDKHFFSKRLTQFISTAKNQQVTASIVLGFFERNGFRASAGSTDLIPCCYFFEAFDSLGYLRRRAFGFLGFGKKACSLYPQLVNLAPQRIGRNGNYAA